MKMRDYHLKPTREGNARPQGHHLQTARRVQAAWPMEANRPGEGRLGETCELMDKNGIEPERSGDSPPD
jgi:hypothetical protein